MSIKSERGRFYQKKEYQILVQFDDKSFIFGVDEEGKEIPPPRTFPGQ